MAMRDLWRKLWYVPPDVVESPDDQATGPSEMTDTATVSGSFRVTKSNDVKQRIFGPASVIVKGGVDVEDHQGDVIPLDELENAAYEFVMEARGSGIDHDGGPIDGVLVESFVVTSEKLEALGIPEDVAKQAPQQWWLGFHIPDKDAYEDAKHNRSAFSIEGTAMREPV